MKNSKIEWTDHTFNPWWGCAKVSPGCANCYAEAFSNRTGHSVWGEKSERRFFGDKHWNEPRKWNDAAQIKGQRSRVFCASMADVFEDRDDLVVHRSRLVELISQTQWLDWLLLTKRPLNIDRLMEDRPPNVWLGTTAEDQKHWNERVPVLMSLSARVRFVSAEPLLGPITMTGNRPDWLIVGGESGTRARPMSDDWVQSLLSQCDHRTAFFFKQWGGKKRELNGRSLNGRTYEAIPK